LDTEKERCNLGQSFVFLIAAERLLIPSSNVLSVNIAGELENGFVTKNNSGSKNFFSLLFFFQFLKGHHRKVHSDFFCLGFIETERKRYL